MGRIEFEKVLIRWSFVWFRGIGIYPTAGFRRILGCGGVLCSSMAGCFDFFFVGKGYQLLGYRRAYLQIKGFVIHSYV